MGGKKQKNKTIKKKSDFFTKRTLHKTVWEGEGEAGGGGERFPKMGKL